MSHGLDLLNARFGTDAIEWSHKVMQDGRRYSARGAAGTRGARVSRRIYAKVALTVPEVGLIAATRGALGFGAGSAFRQVQRVGPASGWSGPLAFGIATTISRSQLFRHAEIAVPSLT